MTRPFFSGHQKDARFPAPPDGEKRHSGWRRMLSLLYRISRGKAFSGTRPRNREKPARRLFKQRSIILRLAISVGSLASLAQLAAATSLAPVTAVMPTLPAVALPVATMPGGPLPGAAVTTSTLPVTAVPMNGLQAKIILVNPRLSHHKGRQLRVFVRNRGRVASIRGAIRLRSRAGKQPSFITETQPLPAIAPGGEVSMTFSQLRHVLPLPSVSALEAVASIEGRETVLPPFSARRPPLPPSPAPPPLPVPEQEKALPPASAGH